MYCDTNLLSMGSSSWASYVYNRRSNFWSKESQENTAKSDNFIGTKTQLLSKFFYNNNNIMEYVTRKPGISKLFMDKDFSIPITKCYNTN